MYGTNPKFTRFKCDSFDIPSGLYLSECEIRNERHFLEFLLRNDWIQRQLGIKMDGSNGFFPDIKGEIYDGTGDKINVEVEYRAENYITHGHLFRGCDLILSFIRNPNTHIIKGIPVWSFYKAEPNERYIEECLWEDMNFDFDAYSDERIIERFQCK